MHTHTPSFTCVNNNNLTPTTTHYTHTIQQQAYDPQRRMESLVVVPISAAAAAQRAGRAGRTGPGQCYRLYTRDCMAAMADDMVPEIRRTNLANTVLYLKCVGVADVLGTCVQYVLLQRTLYVLLADVAR
jgi:HrpA-like RNA helicase